MALGHSIILTDIYVHSSTDMTSFAGPRHCRIDDMLHMSKLVTLMILTVNIHTTCRTFHLTIITQSLIESVFTSGCQASQYPDTCLASSRT